MFFDVLRREMRGETSRRGWNVGVVFGSGVDSTSLDAASSSATMQLSLPPLVLALMEWKSASA